MSFNLNYVTQGLDFSGLGQGIAQGLMVSAQNARLREEQARQDIKEFKQNYNPKNILTKDIAEFTTAFEDYKKTALEFARLNKGRSNSKRLAEATKAKELALNKMNTIYSQSAKVNDYLSVLTDYSEQLEKNKYRVPQQISDRMNYILKTPSSLIKDDDFVNPREIDIAPNMDDVRKSQAIFNSIDDNVETGVDETIMEDVPGIGQVPIKKMTVMKFANPKTVLNMAKIGLEEGAAFDNTFKDEANALKKALSITETDIIENESLRDVRTQAEAQLKELQNKLGSTFDPLNTSDDDLKSILYANNFGAFDKRPQRSYYDTEQFKAALKLKGLKDKDEKFQEAIRQFEARNAKAQAGLDLRSQSLDLSKDKFDLYKQNKKTGSLSDLVKARMQKKS
jgi:hypothetical protein